MVGDHVRSTLMLIGDGVTPGNEGRGYVLRRLMRRAIRSMRLLGYEDPALPELLPVSRDKMGETYAELIRDWERISTIAYAEESAFRETLRAGTTIFDTAAREVKAAGQVELSGDRAFALHDTYGFPIDLTLEMAAEQGLSVDEVGFRRLMQEQRDRAKADARAKKGAQRDATAYRAVADAIGAPVEFTGLLTRWSATARCAAWSPPTAWSTASARATRSSWSSTGRRSTPRAAGSWPTTASSSSPTALGCGSTTCRRRSTG